MDFLFKERDARQLALVRIVIGSWFLVDIISMLVSGYVKTAYVTAEMNFPQYGFEWIKPLPGIGMYLLFIALGILSIGILTGFLFRWCTSLFLAGFTYVFMCDIVYTLNKFYLFLILCFVLMLTDAGRSLSLSKKPKLDRVPAWQILVFQGLFVIIYTFSGLSKLNPDWLLHGEPLMFFFRNRIPLKWLPRDVYVFVVFVFTYTGMVFDLSISWLLSFKKTNWFANIWQGSFHLLNFSILYIGSLSIFAGLLTWLLFPTNWLKKKLAFETRNYELKKTSVFRRRLVVYGLVLFLIINLLIPIRQYFSGNNVNWTEKGHRFSWRLMTRSKSGSQARFSVVNRMTGERIQIDPRKILTGRQYRKMSAETDLVITFAHYLRDKYSKIFGHDKVSVYGDIRTKLNGRSKRPLVDPKLDLTKVQRSFLFDEVSLPFKKERK